MSKGCFILILFLSACTAGDLTIGISTNGGSIAHPTNTKLPSRTPKATIDKSTPTEINTVIPINTPTGGPPPDLELLNVTINYRGGATLIGEIRNNTNTPMVFPIDINYEKTGHPILRFTTESWDWDGWEGGYHLYEFSVGRGNIIMPNTNCFLYPKETGVILIRRAGYCEDFPENCIIREEEITNPPKETGMRLVGYQDLKTYIPWPGLNPDYHPQAENLIYNATDREINFSFDLPKSFFKGYGFSYSAWVMLYDKDGRLISILYNSKMEENLVEKNGLFHITGFSSNSYSSNLNYFRNSNESNLSGFDFTQVNHARVFVEEQHEFLCGTYTNYDVYRSRME